MSLQISNEPPSSDCESNESNESDDCRSGSESKQQKKNRNRFNLLGNLRVVRLSCKSKCLASPKLWRLRLSKSSESTLCPSLFSNLCDAGRTIGRNDRNCCDLFSGDDSCERCKEEKKMLLIDRAPLCDIGLIDRHNAAAYLSPGNRFLFKSLRGSLRVSRSAGRSAGRSVKATSFFN